jgi:WD40 repeat protein
VVTVTTFDVFLSHNSRDKDTVERIAERLRRAGVNPWLDKWALVPGGEWQHELGAGLEASAACAVFIGPDDLGDWELQEVAFAVDRAAKQRGFRVFPVLLPGVREPFDPNRLPHFLRARTWVDFRRGYEDRRALQDLVHAIKGIPFGPEAPVLPSDDVCPYRGLEVFDAEHAEFYFGRDGEIQRLLELLKRDRFLAVLGPSGSGKSSLVRAGLLPALLKGALGGHWRASVVRPGAAPLTSLATALTPSGPVAATLDSLRADTRTLHLALVQTVGADAPEERVVLVVDQLEEVFTLCSDDEERRALFSNLIYAASAPGGPGVVVVTMRADFYQRCAPYHEFSQLVSGRQMLVSPMGRDAIRQAIEEPARRVGLEFEEGLIDTILEDAGAEPGALPLLEYALLELWERRRGTMLTLEGYREAGGVRGALAQRAEELVDGFTPAEQELARRTLLRLTQPGEGTEDTRRRAPISELAGEGVAPVLDRLVSARLLTTTSDGSEQLVDVSHEALIRAWPRLRHWIDADRAGLRLHRQLTDAAREWERLERDDGALYRGARLAEAREFLDAEEMNPREREFLAASTAFAERERAERAAQQRRARRRLLVAAGALLVGFVVAGVAAVVAFHQKRTAQHESDIALSGELAATSAQVLSVDPELGATLARESARLGRTAGTEAALRGALQSPLLATLHAGRGPALAVAFSPDGDRVATASADGTVRVWDARTNRLERVLRGHRGPVYELAFSPDGTRLASGGDHGDVWLWSLPGGHGTRLQGHLSGIESLAFGLGGTRLVSLSTDRTAILWDVASGRAIARFGGRPEKGGGSAAPQPPIPTSKGPTGATGRGIAQDPTASPEIDGVAFILGGRSLLLAGERGLQVADARDGRTGRLWTRRPAREALADARGDVAVTLDSDVQVGDRPSPDEGAARLWDTRTGKQIGYTGKGIGDVAGVGPGGRHVLLTGYQQVQPAVVWQPSARRTVRLGTSATYADGTLSPDGTMALTREPNGTASLWDARTGDRLADLDASAGATLAVALAPGGAGAAVAQGDGAVRRWATPRLLAGLTGGSAAASPDGRRIAVSIGQAGRVDVLDAATGALRTTYRTGLESIDALAFLRDGTLVAYRQYEQAAIIGAGGEVIRRVDAISADGRVSARESVDGSRITFVRGAKRRVVRVGDISTAPAAMSPDGALAAAQPDEKNWELLATGSGRRLRALAGSAGVTAMAFSPDGRRLVGTISDRGQVATWDVATGRRQLTLGGQASSVTASFSPDGRYLVTADGGQETVWDARGGRRLVDMAPALWAVMLPGDREIVSGGFDGVTAIRRCDGCGTWVQLVQRIGARHLRELTAAERARYLR